METVRLFSDHHAHQYIANANVVLATGNLKSNESNLESNLARFRLIEWVESEKGAKE
jgi:hypothetical protein